MKTVLAILLAGAIGFGSAGPVVAAGAGKFTENVLYSFGGGSDGEYPGAGLIEVNGILYGTTVQGGGTGCGGDGCGTLFSLDPASGAERVLYSFCSRTGCKDGASPESALIDVKGILYSTTESGGVNTACGGTDDCGTVFSLDPGTGEEKVLYSFCSYPICTMALIPSPAWWS